MDDIHNELMHFGVLGMHWGKRKASVSTSGPSAKQDKQNAKQVKKSQKNGIEILIETGLKPIIKQWIKPIKNSYQNLIRNMESIIGAPYPLIKKDMVMEIQNL